MSLTSAQSATLKTFVKTTNVPAIVAARNEGATYQLAILLNADVSPAVKGWRFLPKERVFKLWEPSELDNITAAAKQNSIWNLLNLQGGYDCSGDKGPKLITDLFPNASAPLTRLALITAAQENVSVAEQALGCTPLASATPPAAQTAMVCNWIGEVSQEDCQFFLAP